MNLINFLVLHFSRIEKQIKNLYNNKKNCLQCNLNLFKKENSEEGVGVKIWNDEM